MSKGFAVGPGQLSGIAFIVNAGDIGLSCFPRSRRSATVVTVMVMGAVDGTDWAVYVVAVLVVTNGGLAPDGKAIATMLSTSLCTASTILSASPGLVIN